MKLKAQYGQKGILIGDGNVVNRKIPVKLNSGEIIYIDALDDRYVNPDFTYTSGDSVEVSKGFLENKARLLKPKSQQNNKIKKKAQFGTLVEDGELFTDEYGNIVESVGFNHDDNIILDEYGNIIPSSNNNGGQIVNASSVLSDSYEKVRNNGRDNTVKEKVLKFKPKEAKELIDQKWFKPTKDMSASEVVKTAIKQKNKFLTKYSENVQDDQFNKNSNAANNSQILSDEELYEIIFNEQELRKENSGLFEEKYNSQYGGKTLSPVVVKGKREPIYVYDPNDPKLRAYQDSLNLYEKNSSPLAIRKQIREYYNDDFYKENPQVFKEDLEKTIKRHENLLKRKPKGGNFSNSEYQLDPNTYMFKTPFNKHKKGFIYDRGLEYESKSNQDKAYNDYLKEQKIGKIKPETIVDGPEQPTLKLYKKPTQPIKLGIPRTQLPDVQLITNDGDLLPLPNIEIPKYQPTVIPQPERRFDHTYYQNPNESDVEYDVRLKKLGLRKQYGGNAPVSLEGLNEYQEPVIIPSGNISMESQLFPVDAYDDNGQYITTMQPNEDYLFDSEFITEIPVAKYGMKKAQYGEPTIPEPYLIKQGDTLSKIAALYGLTIADLLKANPNIADSNRINIGDKLNIPEITIRGNREAQPVDRMSEISGLEELPEETSFQAEDVIPTLNIAAQNVAPLVQQIKNQDDVLGRIDRTQGTNALRAMQRANRSINLPYRTEVPSRLLNYQEEDVTPYLDEIDSNVAQQLQYVNQNTSQGQAILANVMNNASRADRQIINRVNQNNLQRRQGVDNANVQMQNQFDLMQEQANKAYVDEMNQTLANYDARKVQEGDYLDQMINNNTRLNNAFLLESIKNPNYRIDPATGEIRFIGTPFLANKKAMYGIKRK